MTRQTKPKKVVEEIEEVSYTCNKCGDALHAHGEENRRERLRIFVYYGADLAHTPYEDVVDYTGDFCNVCVHAAIDGVKELLHSSEVSELLQRVARLVKEHPPS